MKTLGIILIIISVIFVLIILFVGIKYYYPMMVLNSELNTIPIFSDSKKCDTLIYHGLNYMTRSNYYTCDFLSQTSTNETLKKYNDYLTAHGWTCFNKNLNDYSATTSINDGYNFISLTYLKNDFSLIIRGSRTNNDFYLRLSDSGGLGLQRIKDSSTNSVFNCDI